MAGKHAGPRLGTPDAYDLNGLPEPVATILDDLVDHAAQALERGDLRVGNPAYFQAQLDELDLADVALLAYTAVLRLAAHRVKADLLNRALARQTS